MYEAAREIITAIHVHMHLLRLGSIIISDNLASSSVSVTAAPITKPSSVNSMVFSSGTLSTDISTSG